MVSVGIFFLVLFYLIFVVLELCQNKLKFNFFFYKYNVLNIFKIKVDFLKSKYYDCFEKNLIVEEKEILYG